MEAREWYENRKVIHFGSQYKYFASEPKRKINDIPEWILPFKGIFFNQIIVNAYLPGEGIAANIDDTKQFGGTIATLSLGSPIVMDMTLDTQKKSILLPRRSLLILKDDARYKWKHSIAKRLKDKIPNSKFSITRSKRISIT